MKIQKILASLLAVALVGSSVNVGAMSSMDNYPTEAYNFAYEAGMTSKTTLDAFQPFAALTREAAARFFVKGTEAIGVEYDAVNECNYTDAAKINPTLVEYVTTACENGLFSNGAKFNPTDVMTRAQAEIVMCRALFGAETCQATTDLPFADQAANARAYLKAEMVINKNIDVPMNQPVKRAELAQMFLNVSMMDETVDPTTPTNTGTVTTGTTTPSTGVVVTPSTVAKAGTLDVSLNAASPVNMSSIPYNGVVSFGKVDFKAGSSDVTVSTVKMTRSGLGQYSDFGRVYFELGGVRTTSRSTVNSDNEAVVTFSPALVVKAGTVVSVDLIAEMAAPSTALGGEHKFTATMIDSTAVTVNGTFVTPMLRTSNYAVATIALSAAGAANTYNTDADKVQVLGEYRIANTSNRDLIFKSVMLYNSGTAQLEFLKDVAIYRNDVLVSNAATVNGRYITFTTATGDYIKQGTTALYTVKGKITDADRAGDTFQFAVRKSDEINVQEKDTAFKVAVTGTPTTMALITVNGADLKFVDLTTTSSLTKVPGSKEVEFFKGTMTAKSSVNVEDLKIGFMSSGNLDTYASRFYLVVGTQTFSVSAPAATSGTLTFDGVVTVNAAQNLGVRVYADIKDTAPAGYIDFKNTVNNKINLSAFVGTNEYVSNSQTITSSIGAIYGSKVTINSANLKFENSTTSTKTVVRGERGTIIATPVISTTTDVNVKVNSFQVTLSGTNLPNFAGATVYVYNAANEIVANDTVRNGSSILTFSNLNLLVAKNADVRLTMKLDEVARTTTGGDVIAFTITGINATDIVTSNAVMVPGVMASTLTVVNASSVNTSSNPANTPKLVQAGTNVKIGSVKISAQNATSILKTLNVTLSGGLTTTKLSNIQLKDGTSTISSVVTKATTTGVNFSDITFEVPSAGNKTVDIYADIANVSSVADLSGQSSLVTYLAAAGFETVAGDAFNATQTGYAISAAMEVVKFKPTIAFKRVQKGADYATYVFSLTPSAGEIKLTDLKVSLGSNLSTALSGTNVVELSTAVNGGTVYGSSTAASTTVNFTGMNVSITNETELFVTVKGVTRSTAANNTPYVSIGASDFNFSDVLTDGNVSHMNVLNKFYADVAGASDLIKNVQ